MKIFSLFFTLLFLTVLTSTTLYAADEKLKLSIKDALENPNINEKCLIFLFTGAKRSIQRLLINLELLRQANVQTPL